MHNLLLESCRGQEADTRAELYPVLPPARRPLKNVLAAVAAACILISQIGLSWQLHAGVKWLTVRAIKGLCHR